MLYTLLYNLLINTICKLIVVCGNLRTMGHGKEQYMQDRVIGSIERKLYGNDYSRANEFFDTYLRTDK